ncbi:flavin-binding monooxygenase-like protein-like protein [Mollisia scopiformis]|uniref:Flavin-binding monooxygenase-like protein-like protein n=1 Tax=Mollisia scopiformis TaxID=149040 RepID=A0A194WTB3_MOLSC|nr:flavin-binding monooxygenase-like protein-like protein [Mollisia scopiformis]KUJ10852.1 flavin-binding monooxygenase-like protein-like protein [Mollisia scopiformis]
MNDAHRETSFDVLIVGAGLSGIIAAQRYLEAHPNCRLTILEKDDCVDGVFSKRRLYDDFWTQWTVGLAEFSDLPMQRPPEEDCKHDCFRAKYTTKYLEEYVDKMCHAGHSLRERVQFGIRVQFVEKTDNEWRISCTDSSQTPVVFSATKLMIANGENSLQNMPNLPGKENFGGIIIHSEAFGESNIIFDDTVKDVAVIGAGKSSADMVYEAVKAGKNVSWIIRTTGTGAGFFALIDLNTPYKNGVEAAQTRIMSSLQPSLLNEDSWWSWCLHSTRPGVMLITKIFSILDKEVRKRANYKGRKSTKGFERLEYDTDIFCRELYLGDGTHFPCDAVLCGTGWKPGIEIFGPDLRVRLGLPHLKDDEPYEMTAKWEKLALEADEKVLKKYLLLAHPPDHAHRHIDTTPYRLYNNIAPLNDDTILFMNHVTAGNKIFAAEAQAIWAVAYFDKNINLPSIEEREKEVALWNAWCLRRYLSNGERGNFAAFDSVPYVDKLLIDIGATAHLKGWWRDTFEPFMPSDLGKAWKEYLESSETKTSFNS